MGVNAEAGATGSPRLMPNVSRASSALDAPMSMNSSPRDMTLLRCSADRKWGGVLEMAPRIFSPFLVRTSTLWDSRVCGHHPPTATNFRYPSGLMCWTRKPTSSMWPAIMTRGPLFSPSPRSK